MWRIALLTAIVVVSVGCRTHSLNESSGGSASRKPFRGRPTINLSTECVEDYRVEVDYFPDKLELQYAKNFDLEYHRNYKVVRVRMERGKGAHGHLSDTLVLVQCGTPAPVLKDHLRGATVITIPVMTAASNENSDIAAIAQIGFTERLVAVGGPRVYNPDVRRLWHEKRLAGIGYAWHGLPSSEVLLMKRPDALFMRRATLEQSTSLFRARNLGIAAIPTIARYEQHYLGMTEWVKFFAAFFNAEREADRFYSEVAARCELLTNQARSASNKPLAIWSGRLRGAWSTARSPLDYRTQYLADSGAVNPFYKEDARPSSLVRDEQLLAIAAGAEHWISDNMTTRGWPSHHLLQQIKAYRNGRVFHHEKRTIASLGVYDWYETGALRPDMVLQDLISMFHPQIQPGRSPMFFENLPLSDSYSQ